MEESNKVQTINPNGTCLTRTQDSESETKEKKIEKIKSSRHQRRKEVRVRWTKKESTMKLMDITKWKKHN